MAAPAEKCPACGGSKERTYLGPHTPGLATRAEWSLCAEGHHWLSGSLPVEPTDAERLTNLEAGLSALLAWAEEADTGAAVRTGLRDKIARFETRRPT